MSDLVTADRKLSHWLNIQSALTADAKRASLPVDIVEFQADNFALTQTQIDQAAHHGVAAQVRGQLWWESFQHTRDIAR